MNSPRGNLGWAALAILPWLLYAAAHVATRKYDGWGAWAAAPMFIPALVISAVIGVGGVLRFVLTFKQKTRAWFPLMASAVAGSLWLWLWLRAALRG